MTRFLTIGLALTVLVAHDAGAAPSSKAAFARVYLSLRGCTSCSHCRTAIRQMARSGSGTGTARVTTDAVEVRYAAPAPIPLREVIQRLADNRLHDLTLVDVHFEAEGFVETAGSGSTFTLRETGQRFALRIEAPLKPPASKAAVRLSALVDGWRQKSALTLVARSVTPVRAT